MASADLRRQIPSIAALLYFEAAVRGENLGTVAQGVNTTQSALSRQVRVLESSLKLSLFTRSQQRVHLTAAGCRLLAELSPQTESLEATVLRIRSHDHPDGAINVGVYPTLGSRWLMPSVLIVPELDNRSLMLAHRYQATPESAYYLPVPDLKAGTLRIERFRSWLLARCQAQDLSS